MDRITKPDGLVVVMDLARLKNFEMTESYVQFVGADYNARGLAAFHNDFRNLLYAAWTTPGFAIAAPLESNRRWFQWTHPSGCLRFSLFWASAETLSHFGDAALHGIASAKYLPCRCRPTGRRCRPR